MHPFATNEVGCKVSGSNSPCRDHPARGAAGFWYYGITELRTSVYSAAWIPATTLERHGSRRDAPPKARPLTRSGFEATLALAACTPRGAFTPGPRRRLLE